MVKCLFRKQVFRVRISMGPQRCRWPKSPSSNLGWTGNHTATKTKKFEEYSQIPVMAASLVGSSNEY